MGIDWENILGVEDNLGDAYEDLIGDNEDYYTNDYYDDEDEEEKEARRKFEDYIDEIDDVVEYNCRGVEYNVSRCFGGTRFGNDALMYMLNGGVMEIPVHHENEDKDTDEYCGVILDVKFQSQTKEEVIDLNTLQDSPDIDPLDYAEYGNGSGEEYYKTVYKSNIYRDNNGHEMQVVSFEHGDKTIKFSRTWAEHTFDADEIYELISGRSITFVYKNDNGKEYSVTGKLAGCEYNGKRFVGFSAYSFEPYTRPLPPPPVCYEDLYEIDM